MKPGEPTPPTLVCPHCKGRGFGAYLSDASGLDDWCPLCNGDGVIRPEPVAEPPPSPQ